MRIAWRVVDAMVLAAPWVGDEGQVVRMAVGVILVLCAVQHAKHVLLQGGIGRPAVPYEAEEGDRNFWHLVPRRQNRRPSDF